MLQTAYLKASCADPETTISELETLLSRKNDGPADDGVPVYLFGNVLPETDAFDLFADCGARIVGEDLCTGSRLFAKITVDPDSPEDLLENYAAGLLNRQPCARTMLGSRPGELAADIIRAAKAHGASGVIGHTVKFCDPYIARIPAIRSALKEAGIPFLMLEGDCTVRSIGQQKTRIEAFIEMLR
jgi:benzoyl-CoA reductase/2-hydroxyglutaryl-CoA dehydratase subunit BcrC/BadD/HgdB